MQIKKLNSFNWYLIHLVYTSSFIPKMTVFTGELNCNVNELIFFSPQVVEMYRKLMMKYRYKKELQIFHEIQLNF